MFQIQSARLRLLPLSAPQLILLSKGRHALEKQLALEPSDFELNADPDFMEEFAMAIDNYTLPMVKKHPQDFAWYTHWLIVHTEYNLTIGGIGGTGLPDEKGEVMIGYFVDKKFEAQGYGSEALQCLSNWMFNNPRLLAIVADTPVHNTASQKVLQKNGFVLVGEVEEGLRWKRNR